ncbi:MAG: UDP-N-acetylglucosamine 2-epimerase (non-hydrolyzing) [Deltaproteobacteria bacterium]|nr:UDP-N-acetylglucosamine 2-epimerase (non-hydrolyzing) [Candidatus Zymogenaceae bacterium]
MSQRKKILVVFGTRPEVVKLAPVVARAAETNDLRVEMLATAQHRELIDQATEIFHLRPDYDLDVMTSDQTPADVCARVIAGAHKIIGRAGPDVVVVQGDTVTAFAAGLAAFYRGVPVAHVEAGLRSFDIHNPFPEEVNRALISRFASFNFCPTENARQNLLREGVADETIFVTGNTVVDAVRERMDDEFCHTPSRLGGVDPKKTRVILVTAHRRESFGEPMEEVFRSLVEIVEQRPDVHVVFPVHPNPRVKEAAARILQGQDRVHLVSPLGYLDFIHLMRDSVVILSDSGGVSEEAPTVGTPVLLLRRVTERKEALDAGTAILVGTDRDTITRQTLQLLDDDEARARFSVLDNPFGDGRAAQRIIDILTERL